MIAYVLLKCAIVVAIFGGLMTLVPVMVWVERRVCGLIQDRLGPNRVGPEGLLQPIADAIKLMFKEEVLPDRADRLFFFLGPLLAMVPVGIAFAVIPVGNQITLFGHTLNLQVANLNVGVLFIIAITSLGVYGLAFGGWASNSKWPLLGGLRASAQLISYEIALGLALVSALMVSDTLSTTGIVLSQTDGVAGFLPGWNCFKQPLAFIIFVTAGFAENNRLPFDMPECEAELVGGYHTEYSSMKFALFFLGEYVAMIVMSAFIVTVWLGGWHLPGMDPSWTGFWAGLFSAAVFAVKIGIVLFTYVWVRWTLPRFRYDQLMRLGWKILIPLGLANIFVTGLLTV